MATARLSDRGAAGYTLPPDRRESTRGCRRLALVGLALFWALSLGGCPFVPVGGEGGSSETGSNDTLATASAVDFDASGKAEFTAKLATSGDVDVYQLGALEPGDRLIVDVRAVTAGLDPVAAVFDEREYLYAFNDDREPDASDLNPRIDVLIRGEGHSYFLGIAPFPDDGTTGQYRVSVEITHGNTLLDPEPQIVYLNWAGGSGIRVENVGIFDLDPFDAADLGPFAGRTEEMKDAIEAVIADRFEGYALTLRNSDDDAVPTEPFSTVYFGGNNPRAFAISEQIDTFDADHSDDAIIFTDGFRGAFSRVPSLEQMATAIGNTAAHEIGHLLGLVHTRDCTGLMDTTCSNDALLARQVFKLSPLDDSVFPFGLQDAPELIEWAIGTMGL